MPKIVDNVFSKPQARWHYIKRGHNGIVTMDEGVLMVHFLAEREQHSLKVMGVDSDYNLLVEWLYPEKRPVALSSEFPTALTLPSTAGDTYLKVSALEWNKEALDHVLEMIRENQVKPLDINPLAYSDVDRRISIRKEEAPKKEVHNTRDAESRKAMADLAMFSSLPPKLPPRDITSLLAVGMTQQTDRTSHSMPAPPPLASPPPLAPPPSRSSGGGAVGAHSEVSATSGADTSKLQERLLNSDTFRNIFSKHMNYREGRQLIVIGEQMKYEESAGKKYKKMEAELRDFLFGDRIRKAEADELAFESNNAFAAAEAARELIKLEQMRDRAVRFDKDAGGGAQPLVIDMNELAKDHEALSRLEHFIKHVEAAVKDSKKHPISKKNYDELGKTFGTDRKSAFQNLDRLLHAAKMSYKMPAEKLETQTYEPDRRSTSMGLGGGGEDSY